MLTKSQLVHARESLETELSNLRHRESWLLRDMDTIDEALDGMRDDQVADATLFTVQLEPADVV